MSTCPHCHQTVDSQAIACPYCRTALKAHGHPGIPLYRAKENTYLCETCTYEADNTCNYPQRPYAKECTLYHDRMQPTASRPHRSTRQFLLPLALQQNQGWLILASLVAISLLIALSKRS